MIDIAAILIYLRPAEEWILNGDTYDGLTWISDTPKPTEAEIEAAWSLVQTDRESKAEAVAAATAAAVAHAKSLGFTDEMITVMYPSLGVQA